MSITPAQSPDRGIDGGRRSSVVDVDDHEQTGPEARLGDRVGRYELRERLGAGGMGVVHAAWDPELDRRVAIKFVRRGQAVSPELLRRRLRREAQAMARLRHPNVVAVYDVGEVDGQLFVAMEYVDGVSLRKWLQAKSRPVEQILAVFRAAGEGLAAAHAEGVIHRDFKPDNVLVAHDGKVLVLDFGLASWTTNPGSEPGSGEGSDESLRSPIEASPVVEEGSGDHDDHDSLTKPGAVIGTLNYMAPEQRRGRAIDARVDQYAFCVALWQALSGELPYGRGGSSRSLARARVGKLGRLRKGVPKRIERALRRGLAWRPDERWPDMRALLDAIAPSNHRWWWAAIPTALAAVAIVLSLRADPPAPVQACESGRVRAVWNDAASDELAQLLTARGELARRSWPFVQEQLDRWAQRWTTVDLELCDRYGQGMTPELYEQQLLCLDRQLEHFEVATELLATATAEELEHSFDLLARLPDPGACREASTDELDPNVDPQQLAKLETAIERAEFEVELGRLAQADISSAELLTATREPGFEPLHVRVAELRGGLLAELERREEAVDVAFLGLAAAERDGAAALRLRAFTNLVSVHVATQDLQGAKRWLTQAKSIASKQGFDRTLQRDLLSNEAWVIAVDGRLDEALGIFDRALILTDPTTEALEHAGLTISRAQLLGWMGKPEQALEQFVIGERELMRLIGPEHPEVLDLRSAKAQIQMRMNQWQAARTEFLTAAEALEALRGGPTSVSVAARGHAAWLLDRLGDCAGATAEFTPVVPLAREHMAYPSPELGKLLGERAQLCGHATPEAVEFAREALELYRAAVGDQHVMVADARRLLARTHYEAGAFAAAREEVDAALAIFAAVAPIGAEFVPETEALAMLIRHAQGEKGALDGLEEVIAKLPEGQALRERLEALR